MFSILHYIALGAGVAMWLLWRRRRRAVAAVAAFMWVAYGAYEYLMYARILCTGECNIRVDLLVIWPFLGATTLAALVQRTRQTEPGQPPRVSSH